MSLSLQPRLRLIVGLRCATCEQLLDEAQRAEDVADAALFGAKLYAVCPGCLLQVPPEVREDADYQRRVRVTLFTKFGFVVKVGSDD